jgi:hypothetical protein
MFMLSPTVMDAEIKRMVDTIQQKGYDARPIPGKQRTGLRYRRRPKAR